MNAYIPLLVVGLADRLFPGLLALPEGCAWLSNRWVIATVAVLLAVEVVAGKIPAVDSVDDVLQTIVRPAAGGLAFGSSSTASTVAVTDPAGSFASNQRLPILPAPVIALVVYARKTAARPAANVATAGAAAPVISTIQDVGVIGMSLLAIAAPVLVLVGLLLLALLDWSLCRTARSRRGRDLRPATDRITEIWRERRSGPHPRSGPRRAGGRLLGRAGQLLTEGGERLVVGERAGAGVVRAAAEGRLARAHVVRERLGVARGGDLRLVRFPARLRCGVLGLPGLALSLEAFLPLVRLGVEALGELVVCLLYTSPSPRDKRQSRMPSSA